MEHMVSSWTNQLDPWLTLLKASAPFFFTSLVLLGSLFYFYEPYWKVKKVPGPSVTPILGHLPLLARHGPDIFGVLAKKYGPIYRFHMGRQPLVIVADAELCKEVGIKKFKDICNRSIPSPISASPLHQKGLFFTRDSKWSTMRKTILALYQPTYLAGLVPTMQSIIQSATHDLTTHGENEDICFSDFCLKLATDIIGKAAFGVEFNLSNGKSCSESEASDFINQHIYSTTSLKMDLTASFSIILGNFIPNFQDPVRKILTCVPGSADRRIALTNWNLCQRMNEIVEKRSKTGSKGHKDFLSEILNARESGRVSKDLFTTDSVSALAYEHLLAGSATTAFTLSSIVYLVAAHPQVEEKLLLDIDSFGPPGHEPTSEDLCKFPYLDQVIKEAMRYYTVSPLVARETSKEVEVAGYMLPKGTWIWLAVGVLAKDPKYFPQPEKFRPERFDPYCEEEKQRHPYAYIPFGIGPRACVGSKFALQEIKLTLIHLYQRYVFRHSPCMENPLALDYGIVLNFKHGVWLRVVKRATAA